MSQYENFVCSVSDMVTWEKYIMSSANRNKFKFSTTKPITLSSYNKPWHPAFITARNGMLIGGMHDKHVILNL